MDGGEGKSEEDLHENFPRVVWTAWLRWPVLIDDAGRRAAAFQINAESVRADPRLAEALNALNNVPVLRSDDPITRRRLKVAQVVKIAAFGVFVLLICVLPATIGAITGQLPAAWMFYVSIATAFIVYLIIFNRAVQATSLWNRGPAIVRIFLRHGCCPACGYGLKHGSEEPQKLVTCSECAASWNATRVIVPEKVASSSSEALSGFQVRRYSRVVIDAANTSHFVAESGSKPIHDRGLAEFRNDLLKVERPLILRTRWISRALLAVAAAAVLGHTPLVSAMQWPLATSFAILAGGLVCLAIAFVLIFLRGPATSPRYTRERVLPVFFKHGRCPACIGALGEASGGLRSCQACGTAWRPDAS